MSRFTATHKENGNLVAYGLDHACGWFYQEWSQDANEDEADRPVVDIDSQIIGGLNRSGLVERLVKTDAPERHLRRIALDLDPALTVMMGAPK